ncbi:NlpC/P60 family protein [soil metagenome]
MSPRRRPWGAAAAAIIPAALAVSIALVGALVAPSDAIAAPTTHATDYPTWQDVQNAKRSQAATQAEIDRLEGILVALENQAIELGKTALIKDEEYAQARDALAAATQKVTRLSARAADAQARADESAARAAHLIAQLARTGGGDLTLSLLIGSASDTDSLLSRLGTVNRLTESSANILSRAQFDQNLAASLAQDAQVAEKLRTGLAATAQDAFDVAKAAFDTAEAQVASQEAHASQMYAQLASLKGTTAAIERKYQEGIAQQQEDDPPTTTPPTNPTPTPTPTPKPTPKPTSSPTPKPTSSPTPTPTSTPPPGVDPTPDPPVTSAVKQAIAYAKAQLGEPYAFGGAGPSSWDCSGLTKMSYAAAGVYIGTHSASNQYATMRSQGRLVPMSQRKAGDLLFYSSGGSAASTKYHVTIYIGDGQMIEAPRPGVGVRIVSVRPSDLVAYAGRPTG